MRPNVSLGVRDKSMLRLWHRAKRIIQSRVLKRWASSETKKLIWDQEFKNGQWNYLEDTASDPIYRYIEKYIKHGSILDLGCGSGNTANEMDDQWFADYTGADISQVAIEKARLRTLENGRASKTNYICCDIETYLPTKCYDIILFRESIFYIPTSRIKETLDRCIRYLKPQGVMIVRLCDGVKYQAIQEIILGNYMVVENYLAKEDRGVIHVFR